MSKAKPVQPFKIWHMVGVSGSRLLHTHDGKLEALISSSTTALAAFVYFGLSLQRGRTEMKGKWGNDGPGLFSPKRTAECALRAMYTVRGRGRARMLCTMKTHVQPRSNHSSLSPIRAYCRYVAPQRTSDMKEFRLFEEMMNTAPAARRHSQQQQHAQDTCRFKVVHRIYGIIAIIVP